MTTQQQSTVGRRQLSLRKKVLFSLLVTGGAACIGYLVVLLVLSEQLYRYVKSSQRGMQGHVQRADAELGFAVIPGATGAEVFPIGPAIPVRIDANGFRVPLVERALPADANSILALGCSFTFGAACVAEETFAERVGTALSMRVHNAGGNGYGLVQMLRLARRHLPKLALREAGVAPAPKLVLVQFAPWLIARARNNMAPSYYGRLPVPYFAATKGESLDIQGPVFQAKVLDLPLSDYRAADSGGRLSFYWSCGLPLYLHDHVGLVVAKLSGWPAPELDRGKVVRLCYGEIAKLCQAAGARMLVVMLGGEEAAAQAQLAGIAGVEIVAAERALRAALGEHSQADYDRAYGHWRGEPPQLLDTHPNALAHERIAASILATLNR